ncbi:MAG: dihydrofolate reductase [Melioribacteraceae bacterium]|nr:dihydrofolate reductase [Melioribacteraceae bacterium]
MVNGKLKRVIIAAVSKNGIIGKDNKVPWKVKEELKHFKETTTGHPVLFGRKTFESIGKPLRDRLNIVISSHTAKFERPNVLYFGSVKHAYSYLRKKQHEKVFICGGSQIYSNAIKHADEMLISHMSFDAEGDTKFPKINSKLWKITTTKTYDKFTLIKYSRK